VTPFVSIFQTCELFRPRFPSCFFCLLGKYFVPITYYKFPFFPFDLRGFCFNSHKATIFFFLGTFTPLVFFVGLEMSTPLLDEVSLLWVYFEPQRPSKFVHPPRNPLLSSRFSKRSSSTIYYLSTCQELLRVARWAPPLPPRLQPLLEHLTFGFLGLNSLSPGHSRRREKCPKRALSRRTCFFFSSFALFFGFCSCVLVD